MIKMKGEAIAKNVLMREVEEGYKRGGHMYTPIHVVRPIHM